MNKDKHARFKRLAKLRGERTLKDLRLLGNLSNKNNYDYTEEDIRILFTPIEAELKAVKFSYMSKRKRGIDL